MAYRQAMTYTAPINSIHYLLRHVVGMDVLLACPEHAELSDELITDILSGASSFASDVLAPLNRVGDEIGASIKDGIVTAAPGF